MRAIAAVSIVVSAAIALPLTHALASTAISPPFNAFTIEAGAGSFLLDSGSVDLDNNTGSITLSGNATSIVFNASGQVSGVNHTWGATVAPPTGGALVAGTTYNTLALPDATHAGFDVFGDGRGCDQLSGTLAVKELTTDQTGKVTAFAATYTSSCELTENPVSGELRFNSSIDYVAATTDKTGLNFGQQPMAETGSPQTLTLTSFGSTSSQLGPVTLGGTTPDAFSVTADTCSSASLGYAQTCTVTVTPHPTATVAQAATLIIPGNMLAGELSVPLSVTGTPSAIGTFYPLPPTRILDTRKGIGAAKAAIGPGGVVHLQVAGRGNVPSDGVSAVVLNVTVTTPTAGGFLTVYPAGVARPTASNLNFPAGWTGANSVTVRLGTGGKVDIFNANGSTQIIADVTGYYGGSDSLLASVGVGGQYQPLLPERVLDTRGPSGGGQPLPAGFAVFLPIDFGAATNPHIRAFAVNVTAVNGSASGFLTTWDGVDQPPLASTLNFKPHTVVPNLAIAPTSQCTLDASCSGMPMIGIFNGSGGSVHVVVDIFGVFDDGTLTDGLRFHPITPTRIVDSRTGLGTPHALGANSTAKITTPGSIAGADTFALAMNVTAVNPSQGTFLSVWPADVNGFPQPTISNLNPAPGQTVPNAVITEIGPTNAFNMFNRAGTVNVVIDVAGTFDLGTVASPAKLAPHARPSLKATPGRAVFQAG